MNVLVKLKIGLSLFLFRNDSLAMVLIESSFKLLFYYWRWPNIVNVMVFNSIYPNVGMRTSQIIDSKFQKCIESTKHQIIHCYSVHCLICLNGIRYMIVKMWLGLGSKCVHFCLFLHRPKHYYSLCVFFFENWTFFYSCGVVFTFMWWWAIQRH